MYRGCTHGLVTPSPVSLLLVVCSALHHTAVSRLISVTLQFNPACDLAWYC